MNCKNCGKEFNKHRRQVHCSKICAQTYNNHKFNGICLHCSKEFGGFQGQIFCSNGCARSYYVSSTEGTSRSRAHKKYANLNKHKKKANDFLYSNLRNGAIQPQPCAICNASRLYTEAHHQNYNKPLEVDWLCDSCHKRVHKAVRSLLRIAI